MAKEFGPEGMLDASQNKSEFEYRPSFGKKELGILVNSHNEIVIGLQRLWNHDCRELRLADISNIPGGSSKDIFDNIQESLTERIDFGAFKTAVQENIDVLSNGKARVSFPDERYVDYALGCLRDGSFSPIMEDGEDVVRGVGKIFGLNSIQIKSLLEKNSK